MGISDIVSFNYLEPGSHLNDTLEVSFYLTKKKIHLRYKDIPVKVLCGNDNCLLCESYETHKHTVWEKVEFLNVKAQLPLSLEGLKANTVPQVTSRNLF